MNDHVTSGSLQNAVVELNVGGVIYATSLKTVTRESDSLLTQLFSDVTIADGSKTTAATAAAAARGSAASSSAAAVGGGIVRDNKGRYFIDRDGVLFRYVLDYLRNQKLVLPECFHEKERLRQEAEYFRLPGMLKFITDYPSIVAQPPPRHLTPSPTGAAFNREDSCIGGGTDTLPTSPRVLSGDGSPFGSSYRTTDSGYITVGYRGTFSFGRDGGQADVKFRKLWRILVNGKVALCREVFRDTLNESRDVDRGTSDRYSARFFLKHTFIEQAFDALQEAGFRMVGSAGSGTNSAGDMKPGMDSEECKWNHYNEFIFCR